MPSQSVDNLGNVFESTSKAPPTPSGDGHSQVIRSRKRKWDPSKWKRNVAKRKCSSGEAYVNRLGIIKSAKVMKNPCGIKCRYKCTSNFNCGDREQTFHTFWQLADIKKQRHFILMYSEKKKIKKSKTGQSERRKYAISWFLPRLNETGKEVCNTFFLNTLGISDKIAITAHTKIYNLGICNDDRRSKHKKTK